LVTRSFVLRTSLRIAVFHFIFSFHFFLQWDDKTLRSLIMQRRRRPRALTLTLPDAKQPFLILEGVKHTLRNFSQEGLGLWVLPPLPFGLTPGCQVNGDIVIENHIHPVVLEIVHQSPRVIGVKILEKSPALDKIFRKLLEPATYAAELEPHTENLTEDPKNGYIRIWFTGPPGTELVVWFLPSHNIIIAIQLCWRGSWIYRSQFKAVETGHLKDGERTEKGQKITSEEILERHKEPDENIMSEAAQFLGAVPSPLPGYRLWQFLVLGEQVFLPPELFSDRKHVA